MFESIRKHQRILQFILLLLIFPAFVFFGVSGYETFSTDDSIGEVAGSKISRAEFDEAQRRQLDQLRQAVGGQFDASLLDTPEARAEILDGLVTQRALLAEARARGIHVSDARLREAILSIPGLTREDGSFDLERYRTVLGVQGLNEQGFEAQMRYDLALQVLPEAARGTVFVPSTLLDRLILLQEQVREVRELRVPVADHAAGLSPSADALRKYYDENTQAFETEEAVKIQYLVLSAQEIEKDVVLGEDDLRSYFEQNKSRYTVAGQRKASHILLTVPAGASEDERKAAREKAGSLLEQLRGGADFAELARTQSQDPGSARDGGDLGFFARADMVKPFADAAWALNEGELSDVVESEFGYHIIKLTGIRPEEQKPFEQVRAEIEAELRQQQAGARFAQAAEQFTNLVYEQSDSLEPAAKEFGLQIRTADALTRAGELTAGPGARPGDETLLTNPKVLAAIFSSDSLSRKQNIEAIDVGGGNLVSARVIEHRPRELKPFEAVQDEVRKRVVSAQAKELAAAAAAKRLEALRAGGAPDGFGAARKVSRADPGELSPAVLDAIFRADASKLPSYVQVDLGAEGSAIFQIGKVVEASGERIAERREAYRQQIEQLLSQQDLVTYLDSLKARSKVELYADRLATTDGDSQ